MKGRNVYLLGDMNHAFIVGVNTCPINGQTLPFFGVCENSKLIEQQGEATRMYKDQEDIDRMVDLYRENGTLIFFQHMGAAQYAVESLIETFAKLAQKGWTGEKTPTVN